MTSLKPSTIVVGLLLFTIVIVGFFLFVGDMAGTYGVEESTAFRGMFDKSSDLLELSNNTAKEVAEAGTPQTSYQSLFSLGGWKAMIRILRNVPKIISSLLNGMAETFGIPPEIVLLIMGIITVSIAAAIIGAVFGRSV